MFKNLFNRKTLNRAPLNFTLEDIFTSSAPWVTKFEINGKFYGGESDYTTERISMLNCKELYKNIDFEEKTIIEFGPLEGGNTIILEKLGAGSVTAIEGHIENFFRCCIIKNLFKLNRSTFYFDNAMNASVEKYGKCDIAFVAGVLYHFDKPNIFLNQLSKISDTLILSTHYADSESPSANAPLLTINQDGFLYNGKRYNEKISPNSGLQSFSFWPFLEDLLNMIKNAGYGNINIIKDLTDQKSKYKLIYLTANKL